MGSKRSKRYSASEGTIDSDVLYSPSDAVTLVKSSSTASFDETIELHARLNVDSRQADQQVRGVVVLPHGVGKTLNVLVFASGEGQKIAEDAGADFVGSDELIGRVEKGWTDFDVALATPDMMTRIAKLGRVLGRKGLMPSPRAGTVVEPNDLEKSIIDSKKGRIEYRLDRFGIIHSPIGKASFDADQLTGNLTVLMDAILSAKPDTIKGQYIKSISLSSTMGPGIKMDINAVSEMRGMA